jgi:DNA modification methylase
VTDEEVELEAAPRRIRKQREYTLDYAGKEPESEIMLRTPALPFQLTRSFGDLTGYAWHNLLIAGDNLPILRRLIDMKAEGSLLNADGTPGIRLIYIDPPFASDEEYETKAGRIAYADKVKGAEFIEGLRKRLVLLRELLTDDGSIFVHLDQKKGHYIKVVMDEVFGEHNFRNEIIWHYYNKLQGNVGRLASDHDVIFWYSAGDAFYFKPISVLREGGPAQMLKRVWDPIGKKLVNAKGPDGKVLYIERTHRTADDVWRMSMLQPAGREMIGYPTQKPEALVARFIEMASRPGDLVLDCFVGSGTALTTAEKLGRRWIGADMGLSAIYFTQKRLLEIASSRAFEGADPKDEPYDQPARPFGLYSSGHYDFARLRDLPFADYRSFVIRLFSGTERAETINGLRIDGRRRGDPILVFDFHADPDAEVTPDYFEELAEVLGRRAGDRVLFIAPASRLSFLQDEITAGEISFDVRRVPYSVVNAMRRYATQPASEIEINRMIETEGFDFTIPPTVETTIDPAIRMVTITSFRSRAIARDLTEEDRGLPALAMVLIDYDHADGVFDLDAVLFGDALEKADWTFELKRATPGQPIAISFCDVFGNERITVLADQPWVARAAAAIPVEVTEDELVVPG